MNIWLHINEFIAQWNLKSIDFWTEFGAGFRSAYLKVSSISVMLVSFSTTKKFGFRFLFSSPIPPSRKPVHVSSSPITAISFPRPAITELQIWRFDREREKRRRIQLTDAADHVSRSADRHFRFHGRHQTRERAPCCSEGNTSHQSIIKSDQIND